MNEYEASSKIIELTVKLVNAETDARLADARAVRWQELAGKYDDIRDWLRICSDNPEGHSEFYRECCLLIFGEYRDESFDEVYGNE